MNLDSDESRLDRDASRRVRLKVTGLIEIPALANSCPLPTFISTTQT